MQKKKKFQIYTYQKVILLYIFTLSICALILYPIMHVILNYPPGTVDTPFQIEYGGASYTAQFIMLFAAVSIFFTLYLRFVLFRKIASWEKAGRPETGKYNLVEIRKTLINAPTKFYLLQIIIPFLAIVVGLGLPTVKHEVESSGIIVAILWVSIITFNATISYVTSKNLFKKILLTTYTKNDINFKRNGLVKDILLLLFPLLVAGLFFTTVVSYYRLINVRGEDLSRYYKDQFIYNFDSNTNYSYSQVEQKLKNLEYVDEDDTYFIIDSSKNVVTSDGEPLTDFFLKYIYDLSDKYDHRVYEHYAVNTQGIIEHITVNGEQYTIGVRFPITGGNSLLFMMTTFIVLIALIAFLLWYYSKSLSNQIRMIINGLNEINEQKNISFEEIPVVSNDELGELTAAFNKIQSLTKSNIQKIHENQDVLIEKERLASLGQMIGGIAHNLKTPIMSVGGASEGLKDLINEYNNSIEDPKVTTSDHHEIASEMLVWIEKIQGYIEYMSDVITAVKGQAVALSQDDSGSFTIDDLVKTTNILMRHELNNALIDLNLMSYVPSDLEIHGNMNSLVQVINNMISNAIQAYGGKQHQKIDLVFAQDSNKLVISVKDYGSGLPQNVKEKLFKEMVTTKGKDGTGLGLFMSYSNIRAHFNGTITFETEDGKGTTFNIIIPIA